MPIEIRELVIRATVDQGTNQTNERIRPTGGVQENQESNDCLTKMEEIKKMFQGKNER